MIENIPIKPKIKFPEFEARVVTKLIESDEREAQQDIRNFLVDRSIGSSNQRLAVPPTPTDRPPLRTVNSEGILRYFRPTCSQDLTDRSTTN